MQRTRLVQYLNSYLRVPEIEDTSNNGLQVQGAADVQHVAFAVDACQASIDASIAAQAQVLIVHHGLFWGQPLLLVGPHRRRVKALLDADCSLYAAHLPLDLHPEVGNNVQLARRLGLTVTGDFGPTGVEAQAPADMSLAALRDKIELVLGSIPGMYRRPEDNGSSLTGDLPGAGRVAIVSGRMPREIARAAEMGYDTFLTGEVLHEYYHMSAEYGINVIFAGHYATETVGLRALAQHLEERFGLQTSFIDLPTGL